MKGSTKRAIKQLIESRQLPSPLESPQWKADVEKIFAEGLSAVRALDKHAEADDEN